MTISWTMTRQSALLRAASVSCLLALGILWTPVHADETTAAAPSTAAANETAAAEEAPATGDCPYKGKGPCCAGCQDRAATPPTDDTAPAAAGGCPCKQRAERLRRQGS